MLTCNIRGLRMKIDELILLASELQPQVMAFTETWLSPPILDAEIHIPGYNCLRSDRIQSRGGGVILYYLCGLTVKLLESFHNTEGTEEGLVVRVKNGCKLATIVLIYRSPVSDGLLTLQKLEMWRKKPDCLILGDFNAPKINWSELTCHSPSESFDSSLLNWSLEASMFQHVLQPTRKVAGQQENILDLIFSPKPSDVSQLSYLPPVGNSDHISLSFRWQGCLPISTTACYRPNVWRTDFELLRMAATQVDWSFPDESSVNDAWCHFRNQLFSITDVHVPLTKRRPFSRGPPWITRELRSLLRKRRKLWNRFKETSSPDDYASYKACRNLCTLKKNENRTLFEQDLAMKAKTNSKPLFAYLKRRTKAGSGVPALEISPEDDLVDDDLAKAQLLADHYSSVYASETLLLPDFPVRSPCTLDDVVFETSAVEKILRNLDPNSSPGPDNIHPLILRNLADIIATPVAKIFQLSLREGRLPNEWKVAIVKPMHKGGSPHSPSNYRPISLTCVLGKCLERLIKSAMQSHLASLDLLSPTQHGFQKGRSCITNLLLARETWAESLDSGLHLDVVFIDFSKAFDKVPHRRLLRKLNSYGISGKLLTWIADFLKDRQMLVKVNDLTSHPILASSGVPQGSVLGPELFKLFVNDLPSTVHSECLLYADDLKVWSPVSSLDDAESLQHSLDVLHQWSLDWELPINFLKCSVLPVGATEPFVQYNIGGHPLTVVSHMADLGTIVSSDFKSACDTAKKVASASRLLAMIRRSFARLSPDIFKLLYTSHIRPVLEYGQPATFPLTKGESDSLERVQRRGTRWVNGLRHLPYESRLKELDLFDLSYRRRRADLIYTRRILRSEHSGLKRFFAFNCNGPTRGHPWKLFKPRRSRLRPAVTLSTRVINDWNKLPAMVVDAPSEACFKRLLDKHLRYNSDSGVA